MDGQPIIAIERPRSAFELIGATFALYRRYPWLFLVLAAVVVLPYQALEAVPTLGLVHGATEGWLTFALVVGDLALVLPLVSALHVYAVDDVRQGRRPEIGSVGRRSLARLSIVSPAVFLTWLGVIAGLVALIIPGIFLAARWAVVAQTGSLEAETWQEALSRSKHLTEDRYSHVLGLLFLVTVITWIPFGVLTPIFGYGSTALAPFLIRTALDVVTYSFTALATAFLFYDLLAREKSPEAEPGPVVTASGREVPPTGDPADPASWSDEDRPAGWYVDPSAPWKMRYWPADGTGAWSRRKTKTPKATLAGWRDMRGVREKEQLPEEPA